MMKLHDTHITISSNNDINQICTQFFKDTGITLFSYVRVYKNYKILSLTSNAEFQKYYYINEFYKRPNAISTCINPGQHFLSAHLCLSDLVIDAKTFFNIDNMLELVSDHKDYFEIVRFGSNTNDNKILELYLNSTHLLTSFKFFFLEKANSIIEEAQNPNRLINLSPYISQNEPNKIIKAPYFELLPNHMVKRYYVGPHADQYLTKREFECLLHLLCGRSSEEIAKILYISGKTVRYYLNEIIAKMEVSTKSELMQKAIKLGFLSLIK